jgi:hypothetical protein
MNPLNVLGWLEVVKQLLGLVKPSPATEPDDPEAARHGTAAGATATREGKIVPKPKR